MSNKQTLNSTLTLVNQPGLVFETDDFGQHWSAGNTQGGLHADGSPRVDLALVEFSFVLPRLSAQDLGCYPIFTMARGGPAETCSAETCSAETFLRFTYEPSKALFHCGMNAGTSNGDLQEISLWPASPQDYTRRVLHASVLITPNGLYTSITDELFGDLQLQWTGRVASFPPWGASPTSHWLITSGAGTRQDHDFPPGFGLSDVRVHLFGPSEKDFGMLPYSGELDHLVKNPYASGDWDDQDEDDEPVGLLRDFTSELIGSVDTWASRILNSPA